MNRSLRCSWFAVLTALGCGGAETPRAPGPTTTRPCASADAASAAQAPDAYEPVAQASGSAVALPPIPSFETPRFFEGSAYTVAGLIHDFRSEHFHGEVTKPPVTVVGFIVKTNFDEAPLCAVHKTGIADRAGCDAPMPSFVIADSLDADPASGVLVMGFASNFANLYDALMNQRMTMTIDTNWGTIVSIPSVGSKIRLRGTYGAAFTRATSGIATEPTHGIVSYESIEYLGPVGPIPTLAKRKLR